MAPVETTAPTMAPVETTAPTMALVETAAPTIEETTAPTIEETAAPTIEETTAPTSIEETTAPTSIEDICNTTITMNGTVLVNLFFADREPQTNEDEALANATFEFFNDTFTLVFNESTVDISGELLESDFEFLTSGSEGQWTQASIINATFSPCAPSLMEFEGAVNGADYGLFVSSYLRPDPTEIANNLLTFAENAIYTGTFEYV